MKIITIKQPWAGLIFDKSKDVENRSWNTNYRGTLLIHAGASLTRCEDAFERRGQLTASEERAAMWTLSAIIGCVELYDCVRGARSSWADEGAYHWRLRNPRLFKPVPAKGRLGLWTLQALDAKTRRAIEKQL